MTSQEIKDRASAYIAFQQDEDRDRKDHPLFWATERFMLPGHYASAEDCWLAILEILSRNPPQSVITMLAAGPLEDLIHFAGPDFIDRIELHARRDPLFRYLLGGVWQSSTPDIWARVEAARTEVW